MTKHRFSHLDLLRGAMMSLGVLVHASHADYDLGRYEAVRFLSGSFRMAAFFFISGFFTVPALQRYGRGFAARRWVILGVPALVAVLLINPPVLAWMRAYFAAAPVPTVPRMNWHLQIWFLFVLMAYAAAARPALALLQAARSRLTRLGPVATEAILFAGIVALASICSKAVTKFGPLLPGNDEWEFIATATVEYFPLFLLGAMAYTSAELFRIVHARPLLWAALAAAALGIRYLLLQMEITSAGQHLLLIAWQYVTGVSCTAALVGFMSRVIRGTNRWVQLWAESAYTVYMVHFFLVALVLTSTQRLGLPVPLRALAAAIAAQVGGIAIHLVFVKRVPTIAFLLNGRVPDWLPWAKAQPSVPSKGVDPR